MENGRLFCAMMASIPIHSVARLYELSLWGDNMVFFQGVPLWTTEAHFFF